jgi:hypothetical protein
LREEETMLKRDKGGDTEPQKKSVWWFVCPDCKRPFGGKASICPHCGSPAAAGTNIYGRGETYPEGMVSYLYYSKWPVRYADGTVIDCRSCTKPGRGNCPHAGDGNYHCDRATVAACPCGKCCTKEKVSQWSVRDERRKAIEAQGYLKA